MRNLILRKPWKTLYNIKELFKLNIYKVRHHLATYSLKQFYIEFGRCGLKFNEWNDAYITSFFGMD